MRLVAAGHRDVGVCHDVTQTAGVAFGLQENETQLAPVRVPRVAHNPVLLGPVVTNQLHAVVQFIGITRARIGRHGFRSSPVGPCGRIDTDGERSGVVHRRSEHIVLHRARTGFARVRGKCVIGNRGGDFARGEHTRAILGSVRVVSLTLLTTGGHQIFECPIGPASTTALRLRITIDELLRTENERRVLSGTGQPVHRFEVFRCAECPTTTALLLIFYRGCGTLVHPVERVRRSLGVFGVFNSEFLFHLFDVGRDRTFRQQIKRSEFFRGQIGKFGNAIAFVSTGFLSGNAFQRRLEIVECVIVFGGRLVVLLEIDRKFAKRQGCVNILVRNHGSRRTCHQSQ